MERSILILFLRGLLEVPKSVVIRILIIIGVVVEELYLKGLLA